MRRGRRSDDPPERRDGFDPYENAADRIDAAAPPDAPPSDRPPDVLRAPSRRVGRKVLVGAAFLFLLYQIAAGRKPPAPKLAADCTKAAFKLSTDTVKAARPLTYTIVGPDGHRFVLGVDTATFRHEPNGGWTAIALPGAAESVEVAAGVQPMKGCHRTGLFALPIPLGKHFVTLFDLTDAGALELQRQIVTVTDR